MELSIEKYHISNLLGESEIRWNKCLMYGALYETINNEYEAESDSNAQLRISTQLGENMLFAFSQLMMIML